jgi:hypothetical protein
MERNSILQTRSLVREGAEKITNQQLSKGNFIEKEKLVAGPGRGPDTKTGRLTVSRNVTSTSTSVLKRGDDY